MTHAVRTLVTGTVLVTVLAGCSPSPAVSGAWGPDLVPKPPTEATPEAMTLTTQAIVAGTDEWGETLSLDADESGYLFISYVNVGTTDQKDVTLAVTLPAGLLYELGTSTLRGTVKGETPGDLDPINDTAVEGGAVVGTFEPDEGADLRMRLGVDPALGCGVHDLEITITATTGDLSTVNDTDVTVTVGC